MSVSGSRTTNSSPPCRKTRSTSRTTAPEPGGRTRRERRRPPGARGRSLISLKRPDRARAHPRHRPKRAARSASSRNDSPSRRSSLPGQRVGHRQPLRLLRPGHQPESKSRRPSGRPRLDPEPIRRLTGVQVTGDSPVHRRQQPGPAAGGQGRPATTRGDRPASTATPMAKSGDRGQLSQGRRCRSRTRAPARRPRAAAAESAEVRSGTVPGPPGRRAEPPRPPAAADSSARNRAVHRGCTAIGVPDHRAARVTDLGPGREAGRHPGYGWRAGGVHAADDPRSGRLDGCDGPRLSARCRTRRRPTAAPARAWHRCDHRANRTTGGFDCVLPRIRPARARALQ